MGHRPEKPRISTEYDPDEGIIFFRVPDGITTEDVLKTLSEAVSQGQHNQKTRVIIDLTAVNKAGAGTFDEMRKISGFVERIQHRRSGARWAFVAPTDVTFGLARMFESLTGGLEVEVRAFRSEKQARQWLDETVQ